MLKVFISYSTQDIFTATRLYGDLAAASADVFQFGESETVGKPSWEQVLASISDSDVFIVLLSKSALGSRPVNEEIEQANYSRIKRKRPDQVIPAIIEHGIEPPLQIERFTTITLIPYEEGVARLIRKLGLTRSSGISKPTPLKLADPTLLFTEYLRTHPEPTPVKKWSAKTEKILANYNALKPPGIGEDVRADHIDSILAEFSGNKKGPNPLAKYDNLFFGLQPDASGLEKPPSLADKLFSYDPARLSAPLVRLDPPILKSGATGVNWEPVLGASGYAVEESVNSSFTPAKEVYRGPAMRYSPPAAYLFSPTKHYRVKAIGSAFMADSPSSNVVEHPEPFARVKPFEVGRPLETPTLKADGSSLIWTVSPGAGKYLLESSITPSFEKPETVYEGTETVYNSYGLGDRARFTYYRVKAKDVFPILDSPWSEVITVAPWDNNPFSLRNLK